MRKNHKILISFLLVCFFTFGILGLGNWSLNLIELETEKDFPQPKTADTNLKIAILDSVAYPSYGAGTLSNDYLSMYNGLVANGFDPIIIDNTDILNDILLTIDVLVLVDNLPSDSASLVVKDWALKGGGILSFDSSICLLNWAGLIPPESEGNNGLSSYWLYDSLDTGKVVNDAHPVMNGYSYGENINGSFYDSRYLSDTIMTSSAGSYYTPLVKEDLGSNYDLVVALDAPYCGRVVHIWDQKHWNTTTNRQMILNSINWIREKVFQIIVLNEINAGDYDYIELYNYGPTRDMTGWYIEIYDNNILVFNYTFPGGWMFNSHQVVVLHEYSGTDNSTDLYTGDNIYWLDRPIAVGLFDDRGANIDWFQTYDHFLPLPTGAKWINDTYLHVDQNYAYRIRDIDTNRASDWTISASGSEGSLNPGQKGYFFDFETIIGPVAIFRDGFPWTSNVTEPILEMYGISYDIYSSLDFGFVDLSPYQKVIIASVQSQAFYDRLGGNVSWFESYAANGGILEIHACDQPFAAHWHGLYLMPGGLDATPLLLDDVDINIVQHPVVLNPHPVDDVVLDSWGFSAHGYFDTYPLNSREVLQHTTTSFPILLEFEYGNGYIIATMQALEHAYYWGDPGSEVLENIILFDPSPTYFSNALAVIIPESLSSWQTGSSHYIEWTTTGNVSNVKIELYKGGVFEMEISANTTNHGEFSWAIPLALTDSTQYQIKITDVSNPLTFDYSEFFEIFNPTLTVTTPDSLSSWETGSFQYINWTTIGTISNVKLELYKDGVFELEIVTSTPNDGEYYWLVNTGLDDSTLYQIKISDASNPSIYDYSDYFEIFNPTITVTTPDSLSSWETGSSHYIYWTSTGTISDVKIALYKEDIFLLEIIGSTPNDGEYYWTVPSELDDSTQYQIKITDLTKPSIYDYSDYFEIFNPTITVTTPDSLSSWETGSFQYINWTTIGTISNVKLELYKDDIFVMEIISSTPNDGEYYWTVPSELDDSTLYQIKISDASNPSIYDDSDYFEIFNPTITITTPDSSSSWETGSSHYIYWNSTGTISNVKIELYKDDLIVMEIISSTPNDGEYNWTLPSDLDPSSQYQIKISDASNPLVYDYSDYFEITIPVAPEDFTLLIIILSIVGAAAIAVIITIVILKKRRAK